MHVCVSKLTIIGSDNGLLPGWRQAIIWTNAGILSIGPLGSNFREILTEIHTFSFKKMPGKWWPFCLCLNVLSHQDKLHVYIYMGMVCPLWVFWRKLKRHNRTAASYINGLMQKRCNSIAHALELLLSCTNPLICHSTYGILQCLLIAGDELAHLTSMLDELDSVGSHAVQGKMFSWIRSERKHSYILIDSVMTLNH